MASLAKNIPPGEPEPNSIEVNTTMLVPTVKVFHTGIDGRMRELGKQSQQVQAAGAVLKERIAQLQRMSAFVGIPEAGRGARKAALMRMTQNASPKRRAHLASMGAESITNAQLLWIQSKGSPIRGIPARPVLEPAIGSAEGRASIDPELAGTIRAALSGNKREALIHLRRAGMAGRNVARRYFFAQNGWPALKPATIRRKGSSQPLIDSGAMRNAITFVVDDNGAS